jgi:aminoglycoside phosphotransferase (APT) family kinase protein
MLDDVEGHRSNLLHRNAAAAQLAIAPRLAPRGPAMNDLPFAALLDEIGRLSGRRLTAEGRFEAGENQSTYAVSDGSQRLVLKLDPPERLAMHERAARVCGYLAGLGYPVPQPVAVGLAAGRTYTLRTRLAGAQLSPEDGRFADRLIALVELQAAGAQAACADIGDWPGSVIDPVLHGGAGFCLLETMRAHSAETAQLLARLQDMAAAGRASLPAPADILHYDFNPANVLVDGGHVSGVVDWEGARAGDRAFDLATMLFYAYDAPPARAVLWAWLRMHRPGPLIAAYLAHVILRQVEWSLRLHAPDLGRRYLGRAHIVLRDLSEA